mmetsp:Transcript_13873/g.21055  ORF Transcript_13873/g.21055 Transcript_13873/m.21055 type:complete len:325 (+) Transcript_13873:202-1176(+)
MIMWWTGKSKEKKLVGLLQLELLVLVVVVAASSSATAAAATPAVAAAAVAAAATSPAAATAATAVVVAMVVDARLAEGLRVQLPLLGRPQAVLAVQRVAAELVEEAVLVVLADGQLGGYLLSETRVAGVRILHELLLVKGGVGALKVEVALVVVSWVVLRALWTTAALQEVAHSRHGPRWGATAWRRRAPLLLLTDWDRCGSWRRRGPGGWRWWRLRRRWRLLRSWCRNWRWSRHGSWLRGRNNRRVLASDLICGGFSYRGLVNMQVFDVLSSEHHILKNLIRGRDLLARHAPLSPVALHILQSNGCVLGVDSKQGSFIPDILF